MNSAPLFIQLIKDRSVWSKIIPDFTPNFHQPFPRIFSRDYFEENDCWFFHNFFYIFQLFLKSFHIFTKVLFERIWEILEIFEEKLGKMFSSKYSLVFSQWNKTLWTWRLITSDNHSFNRKYWDQKLVFSICQKRRLKRQVQRFEKMVRIGNGNVLLNLLWRSRCGNIQLLDYKWRSSHKKFTNYDDYIASDMST